MRAESTPSSSASPGRAGWPGSSTRSRWVRTSGWAGATPASTPAPLNALADGQGYIDTLPKVLTGEHTVQHPPGWPALLAVFSKLGVTTQLGHRFVGVAVGVGVIVLVGLLASRLAGRTAGRVAATLAALHPTLIAADGSLMAETLAGLLVVAVVLVAVGAAERPTAARALGLGILIGAAALVRGEPLLYAGLVVVPVAFAAGRRQRPWAGTLVRIGGAALAGVFLVVAPWTVRNAVEKDDFVLISTNESAVLAGANCDSVYGPAIGIGTWRACSATTRRTRATPRWRRPTGGVATVSTTSPRTSTGCRPWCRRGWVAPWGSTRPSGRGRRAGTRASRRSARWCGWWPSCPSRSWARCCSPGGGRCTSRS